MSGRRDQIRVVFQCDSQEVGGAEVSLGRLLALLSPRIQAVVMSVNTGVAEWIAKQRPGSEIIVLPDIDSRRDIRAIVEHYAAIRRCRPAIMHMSLNRPWGSPFDLLFGLLTPGIDVIAVEKSPRRSPHRRHHIYKRLTSRWLAAHVTVGETTAREVADLAGVPRDSIRIIPSGVVDEKLRQLPRAVDGPIVGCLARLDALKGLDVLIRAVAQLPEVTAVVVGDGEERDRLQALAKSLGVGDRVIFVGFSHHARDYLTTFDLYVLPSRYEALGVSIIEAMLAGLPVVATQVGGVGDAVMQGETGLLVAPDDPDALARAISELLSERDRARDMGRAGRERALALFSAEKTAADFEALYVELSERRHTRPLGSSTNRRR